MSAQRPPVGTRRRYTLPHGFMLLEMLVILGLLAVAALLSARLYYITGQALQRTNRRQAAQAQFDQALTQLRLDVWQATSIESKGPHTLILHGPRNQAVTWDASQSLQRRAHAPSGHVEQWTQLGATLEFEVRGPRVIVIDPSSQPDAQVVLPGQTLLLTGGQR